jgi:hypothetical protein
MVTTSTSQEPSRVADLIRQLSSPKFAERQAAAKALNVIGEPALAALRKVAMDESDLETRRRAAQLVQSMEAHLFGHADISRPSQWKVIWDHLNRTSFRSFVSVRFKNSGTGVMVTITERNEGHTHPVVKNPGTIVYVWDCQLDMAAKPPRIRFPFGQGRYCRVGGLLVMEFPASASWGPSRWAVMVQDK